MSETGKQFPSGVSFDQLAILQAVGMYYYEYTEQPLYLYGPEEPMYFVHLVYGYGDLTFVLIGGPAWRSREWALFFREHPTGDFVLLPSIMHTFDLPMLPATAPGIFGDLMQRWQEQFELQWTNQAHTDQPS